MSTMLEDVEREVQRTLLQAKRHVLHLALELEHGNRTRAARRLGYKHTSSFYRAADAVGLRLPKARMGRPKA
jgi:hypothetical protein